MKRATGRHPVRSLGEPLGDSSQTSQQSESSGFVQWLVVAVFMVGLLLPVIVYIGPLRLNFYRLALLCAIVPFFLGWLAGRAGRIHIADLLVLMYCAWASLSLFINHGIGGGVSGEGSPVSSAIETSGILVIETFGPYLVARICIRNQSDFEKFVRLFVVILAVMLPIAIIESFFNILLINKTFGTVFTTISDTNRPLRWGLERVQGPLDHPILFGVLCSAGFSLAFYVGTRGRSLLYRFARTSFAAANTFLSLSAGALVSVAVQTCLIVWERLTRAIPYRWSLLGVFLAIVYVVVDLLSNRTPVQVFLTYLTFNAHNAWNRIHIWHYGTAEVARHPFFGIGISENWERAWWMSSSMDNFWLVLAVRHGLPALSFFVLAVFVVAWSIGRAKHDDVGFIRCRYGYLFTIAGLCVSLATVHLWNATFAFFMFFLGSGLWMVTNEKNPTKGVYNKKGTLRPRSVETNSNANRAFTFDPTSGVRNRKPSSFNFDIQNKD